jgi:hypothetical protein
VAEQAAIICQVVPDLAVMAAHLHVVAQNLLNLLSTAAGAESPVTLLVDSGEVPVLTGVVKELRDLAVATQEVAQAIVAAYGEVLADLLITVKTKATTTAT